MSPLNEISQAQQVKNEQASFDTYGAENIGVSPAELKSGFATETLPVGVREDDDGSTYVGNPYEREGFLTPGLGYSR